MFQFIVCAIIGSLIIGIIIGFIFGVACCAVSVKVDKQEIFRDEDRGII